MTRFGRGDDFDPLDAALPPTSPGDRVTDFDLRLIIRGTATMTSETDPQHLAATVLTALDPEHYAAALAACLPSFVTQVLGQMRMDARRPIPTVRPAPIRPASEASTAPARPVRSSKVAAIRGEMWRRRLRENIWVGAEERGRKFLADCTVGDLDAAIGLRRTLAARNLATADEYADLRAALEADPKAKVVADLPARVLASVLDREAAAA
ncbi:hypothetical protein BBK14_11365 [Parafrankia soli]|uniref:Uncharacterized protein n=1 Tax=Parafrankia soli TaxID=2599596 RepID=A0A1S1RAC0_9ACTN|nr:hypothetical protein [Parafrankia soli]OHV42212.1 hypothetical protein BBK14_11365 [Parafrankia soli]